MTLYLRCLRQHRGENETECRLLSKQYLQCRMERNLMAPDDMKNLGYGEEFEAKVKREGLHAKGGQDNR
jgi:cytochrome c oxidase assembly protein subunit 19